MTHIVGARLQALVLGVVLSAPAQGITLQFAGFSFVSDHADIASRFPRTNALLQKDARALDKLLLKQLSRFHRDDLEIVTARLGMLGKGEGLALTLALDDEVVSVEKIGGIYKIVVGLNAEGLVFDFDELNIIASFPISVEYLDATTDPPSGAYLNDLVAKLYRGGLRVNLVNDFTDSLQTVSIREHYGSRIGIKNVVIGEKAKPYLPKYLNETPRAARALVAQSFSKYLSKNQRVSVLPYTKGDAIGNKMSARFANGGVFTLAIPEPDYSIDLVLEGFKKVQFDQKSSGSSWIYGAYLDLRVYEGLTQKTFANLALKNGVTKLVPTSQTSIDDWPVFEESLRSLMDQVTSQISHPERSWAKSHAGGRAAAADLANLKSVMEACR